MPNLLYDVVRGRHVKEIRIIVGEEELTAMLCGKELVFPTSPEVHLIMSDIGWEVVDMCIRRAAVETLVSAEHRERVYHVPRKN